MWVQNVSRVCQPAPGRDAKGETDTEELFGRDGDHTDSSGGNAAKLKPLDLSICTLCIIKLIFGRY